MSGPEPSADDRAFQSATDGLRLVLDAHATSRPPAELSWAMARELTTLAGRLDEWPGPPGQQWQDLDRHIAGGRMLFGVRPIVEFIDADALQASVTFTRFFMGIGAAHGGALPLLFDDLLGHLANQRTGVLCRTASLTVDYHRLTPIDVPLRAIARIDRVEGRKHFVTGLLQADNDQRICSAHGLFVAPREWAAEAGRT